MLYNPQWENKTLPRFIAWLKLQPADQAYNWMDCRNCACAQFFGGGDWIPLNREVERTEGIDLNYLAMLGEWTYGALLGRLEAALRLN